MIDFRALSAPFPPDDISWRVGSTNQDKTKGMALAYLDARAVMDRLDAVCGPLAWQCRYSHVGAITVCEIGIFVPIDGVSNAPGYAWVWKADGAGQSDIEAEKGALSDAFKRAAVRWGIGRYLYNLESPWVELDERRRIKPSEYAKLKALLKRPAIEAVDPADRGLVQGGGEQSQYEVNKRKEAEGFCKRALEVFDSMQGSGAIADWYKTPISPKGRSTNGDAVDRLKETFPDLGMKLETAADEVRLRTGARLQ